MLSFMSSIILYIPVFQNHLLYHEFCYPGLTGLLLDSSSNKYLLYFGIGVTVSGIFTSITETFIVSSGITALIKLKEMDEVKRRSSIELVCSIIRSILISIYMHI